MKNWRNTTEVVFLLIFFIGLARWLDRATSDAIAQIRSIPLHYLWWGLGITVGLVLLVWLFRSLAQRNYAGKTLRRLRPGWIIAITLMAIYLTFAFRYYPWEPESKLQSFDPAKPKIPAKADNTFMVVVRPGQPARVELEPNWMVVWWGDKSRFTSRAEWRDKIKIRVFEVRPGVEYANVKVHIYHDPDPLWYTRQ